jgi:LPPG:FO 2-phospho-L-lactate transferase
LPMSDNSVSTRVNTPEGEIGFQDYFVRRHCAPILTSLRFEGTESAGIAPEVVRALNDPSLHAIIIAPSNPYLSIDPILAIPGMRNALRAAGVPIVAVTPIISDAAVKGPTAKIMRELGVTPSPLAIAEHYRGLIDGFLLDACDAHLAQRFDIPVQICETLMLTLEDRERVARSALTFASTLVARGTRER